MCMDVVKQYGMMLEYVRDQIPEICMAAVKNTENSFIFRKRTNCGDM